jgi:hypothetical protein
MRKKEKRRMRMGTSWEISRLKKLALMTVSIWRIIVIKGKARIEKK